HIEQPHAPCHHYDSSTCHVRCRKDTLQRTMPPPNYLSNPEPRSLNHNVAPTLLHLQEIYVSRKTAPLQAEMPINVGTPQGASSPRTLPHLSDYHDKAEANKEYTLHLDRGRENAKFLLEELNPSYPLSLLVQPQKFHRTSARE